MKWLITTALFFLLAGFVQAADINGYAWSENIGWIKFSGPTYSVTVDETSGSFAGYAWSENIGWINFDGVNADFSTNQITGSARACAGAADDCQGDADPAAGGWDGWIKLNGANYGVQRAVNPGGCTLEGWAWGADVVGWIKFGGPNYQVNISACPVPPAQPGAISCEFSANPVQLIYPRSNAGLSWSCVRADSCSISGVGSVAVSGETAVTVPATTSYTLSCGNSGGHTFAGTIEILVLRPTYCEIAPNGPGC